MKKYILNPLSMFITGLLLGMLSRFLDIYTTNLGNIFSQVTVWILIGVIITINSKTKRKSMTNVLTFCLGMLLTYYFVAFITNGVYSTKFIMGWTVFAMCSPVFSYFTWMTKEKGVFPKIISLGIILVSVMSSIILFDRLRIYDLIINSALIYLLFFKKIKR